MRDECADRDPAPHEWERQVVAFLDGSLRPR
jgi:hypothetical protein